MFREALTRARVATRLVSRPQASGTSRHPDQCPCRITNIRKPYTVHPCIHLSTGTLEFSLLFKTLQRRMSSSSLGLFLEMRFRRFKAPVQQTKQLTCLFSSVCFLIFSLLYRSLNYRGIYRYCEAIRLLTSTGILSCVVPYVRASGRPVSFHFASSILRYVRHEIFERPTHEHFETL